MKEVKPPSLEIGRLVRDSYLRRSAVVVWVRFFDCVIEVRGDGDHLIATVRLVETECVVDAVSRCERLLWL